MFPYDPIIPKIDDPIDGYKTQLYNRKTDFITNFNPNDASVKKVNYKEVLTLTETDNRVILNDNVVTIILPSDITGAIEVNKFFIDDSTTPLFVNYVSTFEEFTPPASGEVVYVQNDDRLRFVMFMNGDVLSLNKDGKPKKLTMDYFGSESSLSSNDYNIIHDFVRSGYFTQVWREVNLVNSKVGDIDPDNPISGRLDDLEYKTTNIYETVKTVNTDKRDGYTKLSGDLEVDNHIKAPLLTITEATVLGIDTQINQKLRENLSDHTHTAVSMSSIVSNINTQVTTLDKYTSPETNDTITTHYNNITTANNNITTQNNAIINKLDKITNNNSEIDTNIEKIKTSNIEIDNALTTITTKSTLVSPLNEQNITKEMDNFNNRDTLITIKDTYDSQDTKRTIKSNTDIITNDNITVATKRTETINELQSNITTLKNTVSTQIENVNNHTYNSTQTMITTTGTHEIKADTQLSLKPFNLLIENRNDALIKTTGLYTVECSKLAALKYFDNVNITAKTAGKGIYTTDVLSNILTTNTNSTTVNGNNSLNITGTNTEVINTNIKTVNGNNTMLFAGDSSITHDKNLTGNFKGNTVYTFDGSKISKHNNTNTLLAKTEAHFENFNALDAVNSKFTINYPLVDINAANRILLNGDIQIPVGKQLTLSGTLNGSGAISTTGNISTTADLQSRDIQVNRNLYVTGASEFTGNALCKTDLKVEGTTTLNGNTSIGNGIGDIITLHGMINSLHSFQNAGNITNKGSIINDNDITNSGNINNGGSITTSGNITTTNGSLNINAGNLYVKNGGTGNIDGDLNVNGSINVRGNFDLDNITANISLKSTKDTTLGTTGLNQLIVNATSTFNNPVVLTKDVSIQGPLSATGSTTLNGTLNVNNNTTLGISAASLTTIRGTINVSESASISKNITIGGRLSTQDNATLGASASDLHIVNGTLRNNQDSSNYITQKSQLKFVADTPTADQYTVQVYQKTISPLAAGATINHQIGVSFSQILSITVCCGFDIDYRVQDQTTATAITLKNTGTSVSGEVKITALLYKK